MCIRDSSGVGVVFSITSINADPHLLGGGVTNVTVTGTPATGVFTVSAVGLTPGVKYSYAAYATNSVGTTYTSVQTFTTIAPPPLVAPVVTTAPIVNTPTSADVTTTSATLGGNVSTDGGAPLTAFGVVYSTNLNPLVGSRTLTVNVSNTAMAFFTVSATGLTAGTTYSYAAYASNSMGTSYSIGGTFNTTPLTPTLTFANPQLSLIHI